MRLGIDTGNEGENQVIAWYRIQLQRLLELEPPVSGYLQKQFVVLSSRCYTDLFKIPITWSALGDGEPLRQISPVGFRNKRKRRRALT